MEKIQPDLDVFLRNENKPSPLLAELTNELSSKWRRSKRVVELYKKFKIKRRKARPYQKNKKK